MTSASFAEESDAIRAGAALKGIVTNGRAPITDRDLQKLHTAQTAFAGVNARKQGANAPQPSIAARPITFGGTAKNEARNAAFVAVAGAINPALGFAVGAAAMAAQLTQLTGATLHTSGQAAPTPKMAPKAGLGRFDILAQMGPASRLNRDFIRTQKEVARIGTHVAELIDKPNTDLTAKGVLQADPRKMTYDQKSTIISNDGFGTLADALGLAPRKLMDATRFEMKPHQIAAMTPRAAFPAPTLG